MSARRLLVAEGVEPRAFEIGSFTVGVDASGVRVEHAGTLVWRNRPERPFVAAYRGVLQSSGTAGHLYLRERVQHAYTAQSLNDVAVSEGEVRISGRLFGGGGRSLAYRLSLTPVDDDQLGIDLRLVDDAGEQPSPAATSGAPGWWTELCWQRDARSKQFGFGVQFSRLDMTGRRVPILAAEQGVGRGAQPITFLANFKGGAGGRWWSTYAPAPVALGTDLRGFYLTDSEPCQFDFRAAERASVRLYAPRLGARVFAAQSPAALLEIYTRFSGRMEPLPAWAHAGALVGLQGGPVKAERIVADLQRHGAPVTGVWLQDWVGNRKVGFGERLWWDWQLDRERYPDWEAMCERLASMGVAPLVYVNPFLADMSTRPGGRPDLFAEANAAGHFVKRADGSTYYTDQGDFTAGLIDLSDPAAREWYLAVLADKLVETGALGWMADFGEGLPLDAVLKRGTALEWHNRYPEAWAAFNAELRARVAAASGRPAADYVTFFRSGYARSPGHARLFWLGDQTVTWDRHDGLKSALTALLASGLSGFSLQHGDVGGYTSTVPPLPRLVRDRELLARWGELMAFTAVLRTHEGNRPSLNVQVYDDEVTLADYARAARLHAAWRPLREQLMREAAASGMPVVRHAWLEYPADPLCSELDEQFFLGPNLLVAPVVRKGANSVRAYLPRGSGRWQAVFAGAEHEAAGGRWIEVAAPLGRPGLLVRTDGAAAPLSAALATALRAAVSGSVG